MKRVSALFLKFLCVCGYVGAQPAVSGVSPMYGNPGSTVTITGSNFNPSPANNIVYFGATRATVTAAGTSSLTATVPAGATYKEVSVNNAATSLTGYGQYPFLPTFDNSPFVLGVVNFDTIQSITAGSFTNRVAFGDIDDDGKPDMVVTSNGIISVFRNISTSGSVTSSSFAERVNFTGVPTPYGLAIGDLDGDGKQDLAVSSSISNSVSILRNTGTSGTITSTTFATPITLSAGTNPASIAIGDLDGDGKPEVVVANHGSNSVSVYRNISTPGAISAGSFVSHVTFTTGLGPYSIAIADLDGDGKPDLTTANSMCNCISVLRNTNTSGTIDTASFAYRVNITTGGAPFSVAIGDLDGDGKQDVAVANRSSHNVSVFRNTSTPGSFHLASLTPHVTFPAGDMPQWITMGDMDGDSKPDLITANYAANTVSVLRNTSSIGSISSSSFSSQVTFAAGNNPFGMAIADIDGDSKPEITVTNSGSSRVSVLRNNPLTFTSGTLSICAGASTTFTNATLHGTWSSSAPGIAMVDSLTGVVTGISAGTAAIAYTVAGGYTSEIITITALPVSIKASATVMCEGGEVKLNGTGADSYSWSGDIVDGVAFVPPVGISTYTVIGTSGSCTAAATVTLTVNPLPPVGVLVSSVTLCEGSTATLFGTGATSYSWSGGIADGVPFKPALGTKTYTVTGTTAGCSSTAVASVTVVPRLELTATAGPGGAISPAGTINVCPGNVQVYIITPDSGFHIVDVTVDGGSVGAVSTYTLTATTDHTVHATFLTNCSEVPEITGTLTICTGSATALSNIIPGGTWSSSNADIAAVDPVTGLVTGVKAGTAIITYSPCPEFFTTVIVTIKPIPAPTAIVGPLAVCEGATAGLTNLMGTGTWSSANTSVATIGMTSGILTGIAPGTVVITYTQYTGCYTTRVETVNMVPAPVTGTAMVCAGSTVTLSTASTSGVWLSSHPAIAIVDSATGKVTGVVGGLAVIRYMMPTGCNSSMTVTVNNLPAGISGTLVLCEGGTVTLISKTAGGTWSSSAEEIATIGSATGILLGKGPGTVVISYTNASGCSRTAVVTVNSVPPAILGSASLCLGGSSALSNAATGGTWSSSNTAKATVGLTTGIVTAVSAGTAVITYRVPGSGCFTTLEVTVNGAPEAISGTASVCIGSATTLNHPEDGGTWSSNDTAKATVNKTTGEVTGMSVGTVHITYHLSPGCYKTIVVNVQPLPVLTTTGLVCEGATTAIGFYPTGGTWVSSATAHATVGATGIVSGVLAGTTTISYTKSPGCTSTRVVTVMPMPTAFTGSAAVCAGSSVMLSSSPAGGTWSSSTISKATVGSLSGIVTGIAAGSAKITYTAGGCRREVVVTVGAMPGGITGTPNVCAGSMTFLGCSPSGGTWSSSNTGVATVPTSGDGLVTGIEVGTATISYTRAGCMRTMAVTVIEPLAAISGDLIVCVGSATALSNATTGGTWVSSTPAKAIINITTGLATGVSVGSSNITYRTSPTCFTTAQLTVNGAVSAITGTTNVCVGALTTLSIAATGGTWLSSNTARAMVDADSGIVTGVSTGTVILSYVQSAGCYNTVTVVVNSLPEVITGTPWVCEGRTIPFSSYTGGGTWSSSHPAIAIVSAAGYIYGLNAGTSTITYRLSTTGCLRTKEVTVMQSPSAIVAPYRICAGQSYTFTCAPAGGTWVSNTPSTATVGSASGVVTGLINGGSILTYTLPSGCRSTHALAVDPMPNAITGPSSMFVGSAISLASSTASGNWSSSNTGVASVHHSGLVTGVSAGTATITYMLHSGCYATRVVTVAYLSSSRPGLTEENWGEDILKVYPNPTTGVLNIKVNVDGVFAVYSIDGKQVEEYRVMAAVTNTVSLPYNLAAGVYMCRFVGEDGSVSMVRLVCSQ